MMLWIYFCIAATWTRATVATQVRQHLTLLHNSALSLGLETNRLFTHQPFCVACRSESDSFWRAKHGRREPGNAIGSSMERKWLWPSKFGVSKCPDDPCQIAPDRRAEGQRRSDETAFGGTRVSLTLRVVATFRCDDGIYGQGARCKTRAQLNRAKGPQDAAGVSMSTHATKSTLELGWTQNWMTWQACMFAKCRNGMLDMGYFHLNPTRSDWFWLRRTRRTR